MKTLSSVIFIFEIVGIILFCYVGLCLEKVPPSSTSKYKHVEWEEQMVKSFELAGDLTLLYLQEQDKMQQQSINTGTGLYFL